MRFSDILVIVSTCQRFYSNSWQLKVKNLSGIGFFRFFFWSITYIQLGLNFYSCITTIQIMVQNIPTTGESALMPLSYQACFTSCGSPWMNLVCSWTLCNEMTAYLLFCALSITHGFFVFFVCFLCSSSSFVFIAVWPSTIWLHHNLLVCFCVLKH